LLCQLKSQNSPTNAAAQCANPLADRSFSLFDETGKNYLGLLITPGHALPDSWCCPSHRRFFEKEFAELESLTSSAIVDAHPLNFLA
jgi:hypothetical protein